MRFSRYLFLLSLGLGFALASRATTVLPPEFSELVGAATQIVRGEVTAVRSEWRGAGDTHRIVTVVTVQVHRRIVGEAPDTLELEFLGGTVGDQTLRVDGQPHFRVGDRQILFVENNGQQICPLVAMMYGHYGIERDPADKSREIVTRGEGIPLRSVADVSRPLAAPPPASVGSTARSLPAPPLSVESFEASIRSTAVALGRKDVQP